MEFRELETERLHLKNIGAEDREFIFRQFSDDFINRYLFDAEPMTGISEADELISFYTMPEPRSQHRWLLELKGGGPTIGTCGIHCWNRKESSAELGYDLLRDYNGKGYMGEALRETLSFAREALGIGRLLACVYEGNERSIGLVRRLGFESAGERVETFRGRPYRHIVYALRLEDTGSSGS